MTNPVVLLAVDVEVALAVATTADEAPIIANDEMMAINAMDAMGVK